MCKQPLISIIIPVFNVESYLKQCLDSVVDNHPSHIELILVNDGSTDSSSSICLEYRERYENIRYISQTNKGLSSARNTGIINSRGKYLLFLDSDDYIKDGVLSQIIIDIANSDKDIYFGRAYKCYDNNSELSQTDYDLINDCTPQELFLHLNEINNFWFAAWLVIIKRDFLIVNNLFFKEGIFHEDELWVPMVFLYAQSVGKLNYGFYCYRINREGSIVSGKNIKREFDKLTVADELAKYVGISNISDQIIKVRRAAIEFGLLLSLDKYKSDPDYNYLCKEVKGHIAMINYEKYRFLYYFSKIFGINCLSQIFRLIW